MTNNSNFLFQIQPNHEHTLLLEEKYKNFIKKEGIYEPESQPSCFLTHKPLRYLIENNFVFQDENQDWVLVKYSEGISNGEDWHHWLKTGYKRSWSVHRWKSDTNLDEIHTPYSCKTKDGWDRKYLKVKLNKHYYSKHVHSNGFWVETIQRLDVNDGYGEGQLYYRDSIGNISGKMLVKIGRKIQELKDKGIEFGFYKF